MKTSANSSARNALRNPRMHAQTPESPQSVGATEVTRGSQDENAHGSGGFAAASLANFRPANSMQTNVACAAMPHSSKPLAVNDLRRLEPACVSEKGTENCHRPIAPSTLVRWCKFNLVGGIGILVQVAALFVLKSILHVQYLAATAIAVEAAVIHNFVWHERFTWADRTKLDQTQPDRTNRASFRRLLRFHLSNGAVSIFGNLALMRVLVGQGHMNYLLANAIAIAVCSLANFVVSEMWVFEQR